MIEFNRRDVQPSSDMVVLEELESDTTRSGSFVLAQTSLQNCRMGRYRILSLGNKAKQETKLSAGDCVYADRLASFYHTSPICIMKYNAMVLRCDEDGKNVRALPGHLVVEKVEHSDGDDKGTFVLSEDTSIQHGIVTSIEWDEDHKKEDYHFDVGDDVMLTKECDEIHGFTEKPIFVYKLESILCKFN